MLTIRGRKLEKGTRQVRGAGQSVYEVENRLVSLPSLGEDTEEGNERLESSWM